MKVWTLSQYLRQLREGQLNPIKPFAKEELVEMGRLAKKLTIPAMAVHFPPQADRVDNIYQLLKPVLAEFTDNKEFSWSYHYGFFSAKEVAMGYLCQVIMKSAFKDNPVTYQEIGLQTFLQHICEALVNGIEDNKVLGFINDAHLRCQFDLMVSSLNLERPTKKELIAFYKKENRYNMAYQASLFSNNHFEQALAEQLKITYNQVTKLTQHCLFNKNHRQCILSQEDNPIEVLKLLSSLFDKLMSLASPELIKEVMFTLKEHSTFLGQSINLDLDKDATLEMRGLHVLINQFTAQTGQVFSVNRQSSPPNNLNLNS